MDHVAKFCRVINKLLRMGSSKGFIGRLEFRHDIYKHLFRNNFSLHKTDFNDRYFKEGWDQSYRMFSCTAAGILIVFPIEIQLYIAWLGGGRFYFHNGEFYKKKKCPVEMMKITITKRNNTIDIPLKQRKQKRKLKRKVRKHMYRKQKAHTTHRSFI